MTKDLSDGYLNNTHRECTRATLRRATCDFFRETVLTAPPDPPPSPPPRRRLHWRNNTFYFFFNPVTF